MAKNKNKRVPPVHPSQGGHGQWKSTATIAAPPKHTQWKKLPQMQGATTSWDDCHLTLSLRRLDLDGPFGWAHFADGAKLRWVVEKLKNLESMTYREIFLHAKKQNHSIPVDDLCKAAKDRIHELELDFDRVHSLHLASTERVYGWRFEHIYYVIWWDPDHQVCPSELKHT